MIAAPMRGVRRLARQQLGDLVGAQYLDDLLGYLGRLQALQAVLAGVALVVEPAGEDAERDRVVAKRVRRDRSAVRWCGGMSLVARPLLGVGQVIPHPLDRELVDGDLAGPAQEAAQDVAVPAGGG